MKNIWYYLMRLYVKIGLFFLLKKIKVYGIDNIPEKGALLFMGNHQNALIDAILIPTTNKRIIHFLARASAFKNKIADKILRKINMIPIYRLRDGVNIIEKNQPIFEQCHEILNEEGAVEIFPEGVHHLTRQIIPLKKGFARIILGTLQKYPGLPIQIIPIGINFDSHLNYPSSCSLYYGEAISANEYIDPNQPDASFRRIKNKIKSALVKVTLDVDASLPYEETIQELEARGVDYLDPVAANNLLADIINNKPKKVHRRKSINWFYLLQVLAQINSIFPLLIWRYLKGNIKELIFTNTFRFGVILTLFPIFYILQTLLVIAVFGTRYGFYYLIGTILLGIINTKTSPIDR